MNKTFRNHSRYSPWLAPLLAGLIAVGCARPPFAPGPPLPDQSEAPVLAARLEAAYPPQFELAQRLTLYLRGSRYDLMGFLVRGKSGAFRAVASGEMGGRVFDFYADGTDRRILKKPWAMPSNPLNEGVFEDIRHLFDWSGGGEAYLVGREEDRVGLVVPLGDGRAREYVFDARRRLVRSLEGRDGILLREATYEDFQPLKGWAQPLPTRMKLIDHKWHYSMEVEAFEIHPLTGNVNLLK